MYILGISAYYHDSAAALVKDGRVIMAVEEERFSRQKHDNGFPYRAIDFCLKSQGLTMDDIGYVAYYEKPLLKFERILETFVRTYPFSMRPFLKGVPEWLSDKIKVEQTIRKLGFKGKLCFTPHHLSHAAAAYYPSPFKKAAILTIDGVGEYQTTGLWLGNGKTISLLESLNFPNSLGMVYSTFTAFLGFQINNDEYKVMGLGAYGQPSFVKDIYTLLDLKADGSFKLDMRYFDFEKGFRMWNPRLENLFGPPRRSGARITRRDRDLAHSLQRVTEDIYFRILNHLHRLTKVDNLCLAGGVALNSVANGLIYAKTPFKKLYIFGAAGDNGAALGAALYASYKVIRQSTRTPITSLYLGSEYDHSVIESILKEYNLKYRLYTEEAKLLSKTAQLLKKGIVVGWFQGKMEFGPRALGNRSILANPRTREMKDIVNRVKMRESFRPFAASVLQEEVQSLFEVPEKAHYSPFMNFCFQVKYGAQKKITAIVHADNTCRIQTVNERDNGRYYRLIKEFYRQTGIPCVLNTSFNTKVEPIVENPKQAIHDLLKTKLDALVIGNFLVEKK